ncbi:hypothetical protein B0I27_1083 [Arcticibacter pallidicorallinus]|uniref:Uncharacterized protein n=1 Tax=Arcticibacter pallidicorallinus TaxID=1259464 RepID=A0A2T0TYS2_9SPHI|nr:hypothetical protein [Arcticibacter pallidicorallinus]PRY50799.1 hypothetical protein B0I27_1083 [Arcticibacter pallidicorallinus]
MDVAGIADPTGLADLANATIYAGRGQWGNAGISAIRILPYEGDLGKAGRLASKVLNAAELARIQNVANRIGKPINVVGRVDHIADGPIDAASPDGYIPNAASYSHFGGDFF